MTVRGVSVVTANLRRYSEEIQQAIVDATNATAQKVRSDAIKKIQRSPATGTVYQKYNPRRTHQASSPGNPPRTDTGRLAGAISAELARKQTPVARVGVDRGVDYGFWLEFGTMHIRPRPFLIPSLEENRDYYKRIMTQMVTEATK